MRAAIIAWTGNGSSQSLTGAGFAPDLVMVQRRSTVGNLAIANSLMTAGDCWVTTTAFPQTTAITSLDADGFSVGAGSSVNANDALYRALCLKFNTGNAAQGTYTGNGADDRLISSGTTAGSSFLTAVIRTSATAANNTINAHQTTESGERAGLMFGFSSWLGNIIQSAAQGSFEVGTAASVNNSGDTYFFFQIGDATSNVAVLNWTGNATDNRDISGAGFEPIYAYVHIRDITNASFSGVHNLIGTDSSDLGAAFFDQANYIQDFITDGIQIGTAVSVNENAQLFTGWLIADLAPAAAAVPVDASGGAYALPLTPYTFFKSSLEMYKRFKSVRFQ